MKQQSNDRCVGRAWGIPVLPMDECSLRAALDELRMACASTSKGLVPAAERPRFEQEAIQPAYQKAQRELTWLLRAWGMAQRLPEFAGSRQTADRVRALLEQTARSFEPECTVLLAARVSCLLWVLRHIAIELLPNAWADESFDWRGRLGPQSYPYSSEFGRGIWDLAAGRLQGEGGLIKPLAELRADDGVVVRDPGWASLALRGEFAESFLGQLPSLPLVAWASAQGWPNGLWERVECAGLGCGPWPAEEQEILRRGLGDDFDPFDG